MKENRKHERINKKLKSEVHSDEGMLYSTTRDMSNGGIFISTPEPVKVGSEVNLSIKIPGGEEVDVKGIVRWISEDDVKDNRSGMGIEFKDLTEGLSGKLKKVLK